MTQKEYLEHMKPIKLSRHCRSNSPSLRWICTLEEGHSYATHVATFPDGYILEEWPNENAGPDGADGWW